MTASLEATLLAAAAAFALALGAAAAHADEIDDLIAAQRAAALLDTVTGADGSAANAVDAAATAAAVDTLLGAVEDATEE